MDGTADVTLTERVKTLRNTINDVAYVTSALRSEQGNGITIYQLEMPNNETQVYHFPTGETTIQTQSDTGTEKYDEERTESDMDGSEVLKVEEEVGWRTEVLNLYSTKESDEDVLVFTTAVPPEVRFKQELASRGEKTADRIRTFGIVHKITVENGRTRAHSIEVQHQRLKEILSVIFEGYLDLDPEAPLLEFYPGYEPFIHRWDRLLAAEKAEKDSGGKRALKALTGLLSQELENSFRVYQDFETTGYIDYDHVLLAYKPDDIIIRPKNGILSAGKLIKASKVKKFRGEVLWLQVFVLDWDGETRGYREKTWEISNFEGIRRVSDFDFFPLHTHSESEQIKTHLIKRGEIFDSLCGRQMRTFRGRAKEDAWDESLRGKTIYVSCLFM
ncbi:hypothetical protein SLS64_011396 [Diaporthe eres]